MTDKEIDDFLKDLSQQPHFTLYLKLKTNISEHSALLNEFNKRRRVIHITEELKLIKQIFENPESEIKLFTFTEKGRNVIRKGGWIKYCKRRDELENKKILKENYDLKISAFQAKNPRLPYFISICGLVISMLAVIISFNKGEKQRIVTQSNTTKENQSKLEDNSFQLNTKQQIINKDSLKNNLNERKKTIYSK